MRPVDVLAVDHPPRDEAAPLRVVPDDPRWATGTNRRGRAVLDDCRLGADEEEVATRRGCGALEAVPHTVLRPGGVRQEGSGHEQVLGAGVR